jgi:ATP-dependent Lon protease
LEKRKEFKHLKEQLDESTQQRIMENQKTYFLHEQMRIIQEELEQEGEEGDAEFARLLDEINSAGMPEEVHAKAMEEFSKLKKSPPMSPENHVIRNYLDWLVQVPWNKRSDDNLDLDIASAILDADHYGLEKPKERILEYLAVMNLTRKTPGMILCLVGPPASVKPLWPSPLPGLWGVNFSASASAVSAMRPRCAAIAAPISAPCPER